LGINYFEDMAVPEREHKTPGAATAVAGVKRPSRIGAPGGSPVRPSTLSPAAGAVTPARVAAAEICGDLREGHLLDGSFDRRTARLEPRDRRWTRELVYGMLRRRAQLDAWLDERIRGDAARLDADLVDLLRMGAEQLLFMGSVPAYAAIGQTVELGKRRCGIGASKLLNAVLRRLDRERDALTLPPRETAAEALALEFSHPAWLVMRWLERWGEAGTRDLLAANNGEAPLIARPVRTTAPQLAAMLEASGIHTSAAPLGIGSLVLAGTTTSLEEIGAFRQGLFHLQDPASTLVTRFAAMPAGGSIADVCAAPGGKSVELARTAGQVLASDVSAGRVQRVRENVRRLQVSNMHVYVSDARRPALPLMDGVLVDAPCTGTGTFRRHPDARWRLRISDIAVMQAVQREILNAAANLVRPGGLLVYSTCSLEPEENDDQVTAFLSTHEGWMEEAPPSDDVPASVLDGARLRVLPQRHGTDGAFAARLRRVAA
jgi:16S rRNA (cytosine967-C5)-methyltransferase